MYPTIAREVVVGDRRELVRGHDAERTSVATHRVPHGALPVARLELGAASAECEVRRR